VTARKKRTARRAGSGAKSTQRAAGTVLVAEPASASRRFLPFTPWQWGAAGILVAAAVLRLVELSAKVMHNDEGVNASFVTTLFHGGFYRYDPQNYHGPSIYFISLVTTVINSLFFGKHGLSTDSLRIVTVLFGLGIVGLLLALRRHLGEFGSLAAASLAAVSPGFVFFSRYFIHEVLFVFFSLGSVVAWLWFRETGKQKYLMLASASLALLGATKETWLLTVAVWLVAIPCTAIYCRMRRTPPLAAASLTPTAGSEIDLFYKAALVFVILWVLLYSSFFTNLHGIFDSVRTYGFWFKTGEGGHKHPVWQYLNWMWRAEPAILILGGLGVAFTLILARSRFMVFTAFWALGIFAAYSLVPYKTPWLVLSLLLPMIMVAGYGFEQLYRRSRLAALVPLVIAAALCMYQAIDLSFNRYDDDRHPYSYAHSSRELLLMLDEIDAFAARNPQGKDIGICIMSPEHWPLPWYLRDYTHSVFQGKVVDAKDTKEPILIVRKDQVKEVNQKFGASYRYVRSYKLRPGVQLYLYEKRNPQ